MSRVLYLQHDLQVFHVSVLGLDQLMDVTLSLLLLGAERVQAVQVCTPCASEHTHESMFFFVWLVQISSVAVP